MILSSTEEGLPMKELRILRRFIEMVITCYFNRLIHLLVNYFKAKIKVLVEQVRQNINQAGQLKKVLICLAFWYQFKMTGVGVEGMEVSVVIEFKLRLLAWIVERKLLPE